MLIIWQNINANEMCSANSREISKKSENKCKIIARRVGWDEQEIHEIDTFWLDD